MNPQRTPAAGKRVVDIAVGSLLALMTAPVAALIAAAIRLTDGSPVIFRQQRPGMNEKIFTLYKFRTMRKPRPDEDEFRSDEQRVTKLGAWLRRTSLDELPELVNVVKGDMSLVGPRPLLIEYLPRYSAHHRRRHTVRPGLTGLAQVSGRRALTFRERLDLDVTYVDTWSPLLDVKILARTLLAVLRPGADESQSLESVDDLGLMHGDSVEPG